MRTKLKAGNYIKLLEVPDEETYEKIKQLFKEAGCDYSLWGEFEESLENALGTGKAYAGYCSEEGYCVVGNWVHNIYNEESTFVDESYYVPVTDLLPPSSPEEKISKILTEDVTFSHDFLVELLKVYIYKGYLNDVSLVIPSSQGDFHINLVFDIDGESAIISVHRDSKFESLQEDYSISIPLPELGEDE